MNPAIRWIDKIDLRQISYNEFPVEDENKYFFLEKIDGEHNTLVYDKEKDEIYFITKNGEIKTDLFVLQVYKEILKNRPKIDQIIIPGELVAYNRQILSFNETIHAIKNSNTNAKYNKMLYHYPFDIFELNNNDISFPIAINYLGTMLYNHPNIRVPRFYKNDLRIAWKHFNKTPGVEGLIARNGVNYKIESNYNVDLVLVAVGGKNQRNWNNNMISYMVGAFIDHNGKFILTSRIELGIDSNMKKLIFKWAKKNIVSEDDELLWVKPLQVFESEYQDVIKSKNPILTYHNIYRMHDDVKSYNFKGITFKRFRPDKNPNPTDCRIEQIPPTIHGKIIR